MVKQKKEEVNGRSSPYTATENRYIKDVVLNLNIED